MHGPKEKDEHEKLEATKEETQPANVKKKRERRRLTKARKEPKHNNDQETRRLTKRNMKLLALEMMCIKPRGI